ncbi:hypothetical protein [Pyxidicoccus xibeiensis]|uniref:hypothetical protein n=1 Tax=Pyxidicoccus xibeiensis TaxID=2906759 RepID=UPI0020A7E35D|nr:hypothetical protein [Pyxidicoccus xibeiensis]MCP3137919.1 hypothetical protein [Pyxidicoccus xibeiensis]
MTRWSAAVLVALTLVGCGEDEPPPSPGRFGEVTSAVVLVNPVINQASTTSVVTGSERADVEFQAEDLPVRRVVSDAGTAVRHRGQRHGAQLQRGAGGQHGNPLTRHRQLMLYQCA